MTKALFFNLFDKDGILCLTVRAFLSMIKYILSYGVSVCSAKYKEKEAEDSMVKTGKREAT